MPCRLTCSIASPSESTTPTAIFSPWYSVSQSSRRRLADRRRAGVRRARSSPTSSTPASRELLEQRREQLGRDALVHQQRLGRVADPGPLDLRVVGDPLRHLEVGVLVDVDVAVARGRVHHRHLRDLLERVLQPLAAARDDQVDQPLLRRQLAELLAPAAGEQRDRGLGQARRRRAPRSTSAASAALEVSALLEPRSTTALPLLRQSAAASIVTFGRAS